MALVISLLDPSSTTALRVVTSPVLSDAAVVTLAAEGAPIVFNKVRLADESLLLLVLGAIPRTSVLVTVTDGAEMAQATYAVPADDVPAGAKLLEAMTYAFGKQLQAVNGVPTCTMKQALDIFDNVIYVDSTLGFPSRGWIRVAELVLEYTSRTSQSFALREPALRYPKLNRGSTIYLDQTMLTPDGAGFGTESL